MKLCYLQYLKKFILFYINMYNANWELTQLLPEIPIEELVNKELQIKIRYILNGIHKQKHIRSI